MLPRITITDAPTAYLIAEALRQSADAKRDVATNLTKRADQRHGEPVISAMLYKRAALLNGRAQELDNVATECQEQGILAEADEAPTVVMPRVSLDVLL